MFEKIIVFIVFMLGGLLIVSVALSVLGAWFPSIPKLGAIGSVIQVMMPGWAFLALLIGAGLVWMAGGGVVRTCLLTVAALAAVGGTIVLVQIVGVARTNSVEFSLAHAFGFRGLPKDTPPDETIVYTTEMDEALEIHLFKPEGTPPSGGWPVLVYVHGGGWVSGTGLDRKADMRWFAQNGWLVASIEYSLSSDTRHLWDTAPAQVGCALAWIGSNSQAHGGDIGRLALIGDSAGGNLVINAGYMTNAGTATSSCGGEIPRVRAVSSLYPGVDLVAIHSNLNGTIGNGVRDMVIKYVGGAPDVYPERFAAVSSATHISAAAPPTLIFMTENDHLVPIASMRDFAKKVESAGIPLRVISIPHGEHGFDALGIGNAIMRQVTLEFIEEHTN